MAKISLEHQYSLNFEYLMMMLFPKGVSSVASFADDEKYVKKWLRKTIKKFVKEVNTLDTTQRHKDMLILHLESVNHRLNGGNVWEIMFDLLNIIARLFGFDYHKGQKLLSAMYTETPYQHFWSGLHAGEDWKKQNAIRESFIRKRIELIENLKQEGYSTFDISQIFNTSDYEIKKILGEINQIKKVR